MHPETATHAEYLVSHGKSGGLGRFTAECPGPLTRGDAVVVETPRGLELGTVLCPARDRHRRVLHDTRVGRLLRQATDEDRRAAQARRALADLLFTDARRLAAEAGLPVEVLDADAAVDGRHATVQFLAAAGCDLEAFAATLEERHGVAIFLENLALPAADDEEEGGCGQPGCGRSSGGCSSCGTGGGCSSCGTGADIRDYFAHLRGKMDEQYNRTPLL